jgi:hypothetical protein
MREQFPSDRVNNKYFLKKVSKFNFLFRILKDRSNAYPSRERGHLEQQFFCQDMLKLPDQSWENQNLSSTI